jgi:hypothetical protein
MKNSFQLSTLEIQALENMLTSAEALGDLPQMDNSAEMACPSCEGSCKGDCQGGCSGDCSGSSKG